ncbi:MAG: DUF3500 domain-containing protein [Isosphaeraceae bacterium]
MKRPTFLIITVAAGVLSLAFLEAHLGPVAPRAAAQATPTAPPLLASANTADVVDAAKAFLATLTEKQRTVALIDLTPRLAGRWSNFPGGSNLRNGVFLREMNPTQVAAAMKVARLALGEEGFARFQEIRAADDVNAKKGGGRGPGGRGPGGRGPGGPQGPGGGPGGPPPGGGLFEESDTNKDGKLSKDEAPAFLRDQFAEVDTNKDGFISREEDLAFLRQRGPGGPGGRGGPGGMFGGPGGSGPLFSAANFMIAFLGKPSKTAPWLLQVGGHHLAFNIYYKGTGGASSPYFLGVEPISWKDAGGKTHDPLAPMRDSVHGLLNSLTPEQLKRAKLDARFSDVYVGPGRDGKFPAARDGVPVSELSAASKDLVKQAIAAWTGDNPQAAEYRNLYFAELDQVKVAYSGSPTLENIGDYVRIDGPRVWIEFCCQRGIHYHTIWRDRLTDYGAEFSY